MFNKKQYANAANFRGGMVCKAFGITLAQLFAKIKTARQDLLLYQSQGDGAARASRGFEVESCMKLQKN